MNNRDIQLYAAIFNGFVISKFHGKLLDEMNKNNWAVTFGIGVITFATIPETVDEAIKIADSLMYEVKQSGKNAVKYKEFEKMQASENTQLIAAY